MKMLNKIVSLFKADKPVACADTAEPAKGKRGRTLTELAKTAHESVAAALTDSPMTRAAVLAAVSDEAQRDYANKNWQNVIGRLVREGKARLADGSPTRGRGVAYQKA